MDPLEYQKQTERTSATAKDADVSAISARIDHRLLRLLHSALGLCTEAGEFADALKKHLFYGKPLDVENLKEELGDLNWYQGEALNALEAAFPEILKENNQKLRVRFPDKFTEADAISRADKITDTAEWNPALEQSSDDVGGI